MAANPEVLAYVIEAAKRRGIDPAVAVKAFNHEGLLVFDPNKPDLGGDDGSSFGPFQLHYGGRSQKMPNAGMGDDFTKATGLRADDPSTWKQQTDYVMDYLAKGGSWAPWMGAAAEGITGRTGLPGGGPYSGAAGGARTSGPVEAAGGGAGNEAGGVAAKQLYSPPTTATILADAVGSEPINDLATDLNNPYGGLASALAQGVGRDGGSLGSDASTALPIPTVDYASAIPQGQVAPDLDMPPLDLASLFKVDGKFGQPVAASPYGRTARQYG